MPPFTLINFKNIHLLNYEVNLISLSSPQGVIQYNVSLNLILNVHSIIDKIKCNLNYSSANNIGSNSNLRKSYD